MEISPKALGFSCKAVLYSHHRNSPQTFRPTDVKLKKLQWQIADLSEHLKKSRRWGWGCTMIVRQVEKRGFCVPDIGTAYDEQDGLFSRNRHS